MAYSGEINSPGFNKNLRKDLGGAWLSLYEYFYTKTLYWLKMCNSRDHKCAIRIMDQFRPNNETATSKFLCQPTEVIVPEVKIRSKTVIKNLPGPFQAAYQVQRRDNLCVKGKHSGPVPGDKDHGGVLLPSLYSIMHQLVKDKAKGTHFPSEIFKLPHSPTAEIATNVSIPILKVTRRRKLKKNELLLRGNSLEVDSKQVSKPGKNQHSFTNHVRASFSRMHGDAAPSKSHIGLPKRSTIPCITPEITFTVIENKVQDNRDAIPRLSQSTTNLLAAPKPFGRQMMRCDTITISPEPESPMTPLLSDCFSSKAASPKSSMRSDSSPERDFSIDCSFYENPSPYDAGIWHPWATHLTPFQELIDMRIYPYSKVHLYLNKRKSDFQPEIEPLDLLEQKYQPQKLVLKPEVRCICAYHLHSRNLKKFSLQRITTLQCTLFQRKVCKLQQLIAPNESNPCANSVLIILIDGVLADLHKSNLFDRAPASCYLRPDTIDGLRRLSKMFVLVFVSAFPLRQLYKLLGMLIQRRVQVTAAYTVLGCKADVWSLEKYAESFQDYGLIFSDLGITELSTRRVMMIGALQSDAPSMTDTALYTESGVTIKLHANHLPVVMPGQGLPIVTMLIPHIALGGCQSALKFSVICNEILNVYRATPNHYWDESFQVLSTTNNSAVSYPVRTHKIHEAYYSYLLPLLRSEDYPGTEVTEKERQVSSQCQIHQNAHQILRQIAENRLILVNSDILDNYAQCEVVDSDPMVATKNKYLNLMDFALFKETAGECEK